MATAIRTQRRYDHRLRNLVRTTRDVHCAIQRGVPRSTARGWLTGPDAPIVTFDAVDMNVTQLRREVLQLRRRVQKLTALLRVLLVVLKLSGYALSQARLRDGGNKRSLLRAIERSRAALPLRSVLRVVRLSPSRYHAWSREARCCALDDRSSCPRSSPQQLTAVEVGVIQELVTSEDYRHVPTGTLSRLAQRIDKVYASASTWYRLVREHRWRRPRQRVHPAAPKVGIRAARPNEIWHIDTSVLRLLDGSRAYLQAVIDNFSRRVLAWKVTGTFDPNATVGILLTAAKGFSGDKPMLVADSGVENFNGAVDELIASGLLSRVLAQTEITFSNSMIESWWRVLKHQWLFLNTLDSVRTVEKLVAFYVEQHNKHLPHTAFHGQTPDEMYFSTGADIPKQLAAAKVAARQARLAGNRAVRCQRCSEPVAIGN